MISSRPSSGLSGKQRWTRRAYYQVALAHRREYELREAQARRERHADPARQARLAEDQARIDAVLAETEQ